MQLYSLLENTQELTNNSENNNNSKRNQPRKKVFAQDPLLWKVNEHKSIFNEYVIDKNWNCCISKFV